MVLVVTSVLTAGVASTPLGKVDRQFSKLSSTQRVQIDLCTALVQQVEDHIVLCRRGTLQELHCHIHILSGYTEGVSHAVRHDHMGQLHIGRVKGHLWRNSRAAPAP